MVGTDWEEERNPSTSHCLLFCWGYHECLGLLSDTSSCQRIFLHVHGTHMAVCTMVLNSIGWSWLPDSSYMVSMCFLSPLGMVSGSCYLWFLGCFTGSPTISSHIQSVPYIKFPMFEIARVFVFLIRVSFNTIFKVSFVTQVTKKAAVQNAFLKSAS